MGIRHRKKHPVADRGAGTARVPARSGDSGEDSCRCKETADMTPRQLLGLMMRDLAFWKKSKKE